MRPSQIIVLVFAFLILLAIVLFLLNVMGVISLNPCPCESLALLLPAIGQKGTQ